MGVKICLLTLIIMVISMSNTIGFSQPEQKLMAINEISPEAPVGERPYEMVWANRKEERKPLVDFEDISGWYLETFEGATAELRRSREQQMWGNYVAKLTYRCASERSWLMIRPPEPIPIPNKFDCINIWVYGNRWAWESDPTTPAAELAIHFEDAEGRPYRIYMTHVQWKEWWLVHRRINKETLDNIAFPCKFTALEVRGRGNKEDRLLFFDSLSFYIEVLKPLTFQPRPKRNLKLFEGQSPGLNTGPGKLPFPTREETILPTNYEPKFTNRVKEIAKNKFQFSYRAKDAKVTYIFDATKELSGIEALVNGKKVARPLDKGGIVLESKEEPKFETAKLSGRTVTAKYSPNIEYRLQIMQKSLIIDAICPGGKATELTFGTISEVSNPELIYVPFITFGGGPQPEVLMSRLPDNEPVFTSIWADWYRSNGSELYAANAQGRSYAKINGGIRYHKKTDGTRNDLFERIFLTISPVFEETLPTIANPKGLHADMAGDRLWQESWGPADFNQEHQRSKKLRAYGIEKLIQCNHEISWRDAGESFTLRIHAAPKKGGDAAQAQYIKNQQSLGWLAGLYTNYTDFAPVNEHWDEDAVQRTPDNDWRPAWPRNYALKPSRAVEFENKLAPIIKQKYNPNSSYTDVHTAVAPWAYCDYDARVPGAGTFAATFYAYGELLRNDSKVYGGPIFSEGTYQWLYAGLTDGNYGHVYNGINLSEQPMLPSFDLLKIHPLECDIGVSWTSFYFADKPGWNAPEVRDHNIDRFIAAEMAYGHIGWLVEDYLGMNLVCRSYYMMQQLQKRYALQAPKSIQYWNGEKYVSTSQALATGAYRDSQLHILYPSGLKLWINGSTDKSWTVHLGKEAYELPPASWLAKSPDFFEFSGVYEGHRVDFVNSPEYIYLDGRGEMTKYGGVAAKSGIAIRKLSKNQIEIIDISESKEFGFGNPFGIPGVPAKCEAFDIEGKSLGSAEIRRTEELNWIIGLPKGLRYIITFSSKKTAPRVSLIAESNKIPAGAKVKIKTQSSKPMSLYLNDVPCPSKDLVAIPAEAKAGDRLWLKGLAGREIIWCDFTIVPLAELKLQPPVLNLPKGTAKAKLLGRLNLIGTGATAAEILIAPPNWLKVTPERFYAKGKVDQFLEFSLENAPEKSEAKLLITVQAAEFTETKTLALEIDEAPIIIYRLDDPSLSFDWGYAFRKEKEKPGETATGALFFREKQIPVGGLTKDGLFCHPPYIGGVGYCFALFPPLRIPEEPSELHLFVGLKDGGDPSDGVDFSIQVIDEGGRVTQLVKEHGIQYSWKEVLADLSPFAGQKIQLKLIADVGENDNSVADWASWGEPVIRLKKPVPRLTIKNE